MQVQSAAPIRMANRKPRITRWSELHEAISAMLPGDPPLPWAAPPVEDRRAMLESVNHYARTRGIPIWTRFWGGQLLIVRLPGVASNPASNVASNDRI